MRTGRRNRLSGGGGCIQAVSLALDEIYTGGRADADDAELVLLTASVARHGVLQPVLVRWNADAGRYAIICGARRVHAARRAGLTQIPALVLDCGVQEAAAIYLEEHLTRKAPGFLHEAEMIERAGEQAVLENFALPGALLGERLRMLGLPESVRREIERNTLALEQAKPLLHIKDECRQLEAASIIAQRALTGMQARRLVFGPQTKGTRHGRRRSVSVVTAAISRVVESLRAKGIPLQVNMHSQEGGMCIQIIVKNDASSFNEAGKAENSANYSRVEISESPMN